MIVESLPVPFGGIALQESRRSGVGNQSNQSRVYCDVTKKGEVLDWKGLWALGDFMLE